MTPARLQAVLFDFYGTLAHAVAWGPTFEELFGRRGIVIDETALSAWRAEVDDGAEHAEHSVDRDAYVAWERARLRRLLLACGAAKDVLAAAVDEVYTATKTYTLAAYEETADVLSAVRDAGLTVAVCSNWDWDLDRALAAVELSDLVDVTVTSAQAGARKPHPRIYHQTLQRCGVQPADALFVGDSWGPDVEGPGAVGMRPVHVWRSEEKAPADGVDRVRDLRGVLDLAYES